MTYEGRYHDTSVVKLDSAHSPRGPMGEKYLASGVRVSMRIWEAEPPTGAQKHDVELGESERDYEVVGYVIAGRAELHLEGQMVLLEPGSSYVVPRGARHFYRVLEPFTAVEATSPPAHVHGRDAPPRPSRGPKEISTEIEHGRASSSSEDSWRPSDAAPGAHRH